MNLMDDDTDTRWSVVWAGISAVSYAKVYFEYSLNKTVKFMTLELSKQIRLIHKF